MVDPHLLDGKATKRRETEIVKAVQQYLSARRIFNWRNNAGAALSMRSDGAQHLVRFGMPGLPDILGVIPPTGRLLGIEVKRPGQIPTARQAMRIRALTDAGALAFVAHSIYEVAQALDAAGVKGL